MLAALLPLAISDRLASGAYQSRVYFAGTPCRWVLAARDLTVDVCTRAGRSGGMIVSSEADVDDVRLALIVDLVFATTFAVVGVVLMRVGRQYWAPPRRREYGRWSVLPWTAVAAGGLDLVETLGQLVWIDDASPPTLVTHLVAMVAWWKWCAYVVAAVGCLGVVALSCQRDEQDRRVEPDRHLDCEERPGEDCFARAGFRPRQ